jgi:hypothetical protein
MSISFFFSSIIYQSEKDKFVNNESINVIVREKKAADFCIN